MQTPIFDAPIPAKYGTIYGRTALTSFTAGYWPWVCPQTLTTIYCTAKWPMDSLQRHTLTYTKAKTQFRMHLLANIWERKPLITITNSYPRIRSNPRIPWLTQVSFGPCQFQTGMRWTIALHCHVQWAFERRRNWFVGGNVYKPIETRVSEPENDWFIGHWSGADFEQ